MHNIVVRGSIILASLLYAFIQSASVYADNNAESQKQSTRPNIIILLADDLGYGDLSSYGHPSIETPALDRLAAEGQRWTDFYVNAPLCSSSRGSLMTGKLPVRSGLYGIKKNVLEPNAKVGIPPQYRTIAEALKEAGYDTAILGKWHLGDNAAALPTRHGFDYWLGTPYSNDMDWWEDVPNDFLKKLKAGELTTEEIQQTARKFFAARLDPDRKSSQWNTSLISSHKSPSGYVDKVIERPAQQERLTWRYTEEAISYIKARAQSEKPFLLYLAYNMPHAPTFASKNFKGKSLRGDYGDAVEEIDWSANEIRKALEETRLAENTLLVFSSDNGPVPVIAQGGSAGLLRGEKRMTLEGGMRVPGVFWWPGHIKPGVVHDIGSLMDLYATALSLAGITGVTDAADSIDLSPVFAGKPGLRNAIKYYSITGQLLGYRKGAWKVSFTEDGVTLSDKAALYNLAHDPSELIDLSKVHPTTLKELVAEAKEQDIAIPRAAPIFDQQ